MIVGRGHRMLCRLTQPSYRATILPRRTKSDLVTSRIQQAQSITKDLEQADKTLRARPSDAFFDDVMAGGPRPPVQIDAVLNQGRGFQLSTGMEVPTAVFVINGEALLWRPSFEIDSSGTLNFENESFGVLDISARKPDMLILGTGRRNEFVNRSVRDYLHGLGVQVDTMDTRNAASTFNVLAAEGRSVALAVLCT